MRFVKCFVLVLCFCFCLSVPAFAEEPVEDSSSDVSSAADSESSDSALVESSDESIVDAFSEDPVVSSLVDDSVSGYSTYALDDATTIFTAAIGWAGDVGETIVDTPLLLMFVVIPLVGLGVGLFKRLINIR